MRFLNLLLFTILCIAFISCSSNPKKNENVNDISINRSLFLIDSLKLNLNKDSIVKEFEKSKQKGRDSAITFAKLLDIYIFNISDNTNTSDENKEVEKYDENISLSNSTSKKEIQFVLTHFYDEKLPKNFLFIVNRNKKIILDYQNGKTTDFVITDAPENSTCGIMTVDQNGDRCQICVEGDANSVIIDLNYFDSDVKMRFKGYLKE